MTPVEQAAQEGYSPEEVNAFLSQRAKAAKDAGYSDPEISAYIKDTVIQQPAFNKTPIATTGNAQLAPRPSPKTLLDAIQTGWNWSTPALGREALKGPDGKLPEMAVNQETPWYLRAAANLTSTVADVPAMIAGGVIGGGGGPVTALGGAFALPAGLRKVFMDSLENGSITSRKDFADRVTETMWETAKGWITGAATAGAGKLATEAVSALPAAAKAVLPTATELATLTEVSARLEGHAPDPQALIDNGIVLGVAKAVVPNWATVKPPKVMADIYVKTGIHPSEVTQDAIRGDMGVWQDVLDGKVPDAYKGKIETPPSPPTQRQLTKAFHGTAAPKFTEFEGTPTKTFYYDPATGTSGAIDHNAVYLTSHKELAEAWSKVNRGDSRVLQTEIEGELLTVDAQGQSLNNVEGLAFKHAMEQGKVGVRFENVIDSPNDAQATPATVFAVFDPKKVKIVEDAPSAPTQAQRTVDFPSAPKQPEAKTTDSGEQIFSNRLDSGNYGAKVGDLLQGNRYQLLVDPSGGYFWGDWKLASERDKGRVIVGEHKNFAPAEFATGQAAREAAAATPRSKTAPNGEEPTPQKAAPAKPLTPEQQAQARAFLELPFAAIPQAPNEPSRPTHMNYNRIDTTEDAAQALSRLSDIYESKIKDQQQSPRTWAKSHEDAAQVLGDLLGSDAETVAAFLKGEPASPSTTARLLARKELAVGFTEDLMRSRAALLAKGDAATPEELAGFLAQVEKVSNVQAGFLGQRADLARALNALKSSRNEAVRTQAILDAIHDYGGTASVHDLLAKLGEYDNPAQVVQFAKQATKATTREMLIEAWKAGLVSGLRTNEVNFLSTAAFTAMRIPTESLAAAYGLLSKAEDRVLFSEIPARLLGMTIGLRDGFTIAGAVLRTGDNVTGPKTDSFTPKIPGKIGEVARLPFRSLAASDALLKAVNERGELYADATRQAVKEGHTIGSPAFFDRVVELTQRPTAEAAQAATEAGQRYTFTKPLGPKGQSFQRMVKEVGLEWMFPFITTPGNIFKETARMTPGVNLAVKEWRAAWEAGGIARDRAMAEVTVGSMIAATVIAAATEGIITGNGQPDKRMRATDRAAGWKPYAVKINGQYYDGYLRMAPIGPLMGLTADAHEFWNYMTHDERDQWARMLAFAFAQNVTNQTFMTGATNFVNVLQDPSRYGENYLESLAGSVVPAILGQTAAERDPLIREIHGMRDAMRARIPGMREGLMPSKDLFGVPIASPERLWWGSPFSVSSASIDKVRTEASRIGFATPDIPKSLDVLPGKQFGTLDKIRLTPEQKDVFATTSGQLAYQVLSSVVASPGWDSQPTIIQRQTYEKVFQTSRAVAMARVLAGADPAVTEQAVQAVRKALNP